MNQEELIEEYVEDLLVERGINEDTPLGIRDQMKKDIKERLNNFLISKIVDALPQDKITELDELVRENNQEKIWDYVRKNIPDFNNFSLSALLEFRKKYLNL